MPVGDVGVFKAPTDMLADPKILARVGPGTESAALVTGSNDDGSLVNLRVFPDQQEEFSLRGVKTVDDALLGSFAPGSAPVTEGGETQTQKKAREATEKKRKEEEQSKKKGG